MVIESDLKTQEHRRHSEIACEQRYQVIGVGFVKLNRTKLNTEAQRTQSCSSRISSVISVPLCLKNEELEVLNIEASELEQRIANNVTKLLESGL